MTRFSELVRGEFASRVHSMLWLDGLAAGRTYKSAFLKVPYILEVDVFPCAGLETDDDTSHSSFSSTPSCLLCGRPRGVHGSCPTIAGLERETREFGVLFSRIRYPGQGFDRGI